MTAEGMGWVSRFAQEKRELLSTTGWHLVIRAIGTEMIEGLYKFQSDADIAKAHHAHLRCFRSVVVNFLESCCKHLSYMLSYRAWLCFSYATRALNMHLSPAPEGALCIFSGEKADYAVEFTYIHRELLSGIECPTRSSSQAHLFVNENFINVMNAWMLIGHIETFLREMLAETLHPALEVNNKPEAYRLLESALTTNEDLRESISAANDAAYTLHQINTLARITPQALNAALSDTKALRGVAESLSCTP